MIIDGSLPGLYRVITETLEPGSLDFFIQHLGLFRPRVGTHHLMLPCVRSGNVHFEAGNEVPDPYNIEDSYWSLGSEDADMEGG